MTQTEDRARPGTPTTDDVAREVGALVARAQLALGQYDLFDQEQIDHIVKKASVAGLHHHGRLAQIAVEETGRGTYEDKAVKNIFACEHVTHHMAKTRTVGVIARDEVNGIIEIADPVGVVAGVTPVTNPTSTTIFKALLALKTRNPIIFAFHPGAQRCSAEAAAVIRDAAVAAGAPEHCIQWIGVPTLEATAAQKKRLAALLTSSGPAAKPRATGAAGQLQPSLQ